MDVKPVVTYAGDEKLFASLQPLISQSLPQEPTEWRRSYGRPVKSVFVDANFVPFAADILPKESDRKLIGKPILHVFWTDCVDVDIYKASVRDEIENWLKILTQHAIQDWMIVIVETPELKKTNKLLPRTTVLDKIRNEFASKTADRVVSAVDPIRSESRWADSWRGTLARLRLLILTAYNTALIRFEDLVRVRRERRNEPGWSFCQYFLLQEELAFVLEMLGLYDEALVQYDELDALFTQFVLNSSVGETPSWLCSFQRPLEKWSGIWLNQSLRNGGLGMEENEGRKLIQNGCASLLDLRGYLFSRQCALLLLTCKPWEIAQRTLPFLHNCMRESILLEVSSPPGATACWVILCCLEILSTCERFTDSAHVSAYSLYTAPLWAYARDKLCELGELCGLMPGEEPTSEQLHMVVSLSAGMGDPPMQSASSASVSSSNSSSNPPTKEGNSAVGSVLSQPGQTPTDKLKEALSSQEAFKRHYLELAELAMGTFKHIKRIRSARSVGRDLAHFYLKMGQPSQSATFLADALDTFQVEGWMLPKGRTAAELAECYHAAEDWGKYAKMCAAVASCPVLDKSERIEHFESLLSTLPKIKNESLILPFGDSFTLRSVEIVSNRASSPGGYIEAKMVVECLLPGECVIKRVQVSAERVTRPTQEDRRAGAKVGRKGTTKGRGGVRVTPRGQTTSNDGIEDANDDDCADDVKCRRSSTGMISNQETMPILHMAEHLDYLQDGGLASASLVCRDPKKLVRRQDSQGKYRKISTDAVPHTDFSNSLTAKDVTIVPGKNVILVKAKGEGLEQGTYRLGQLSLKLVGTSDEGEESQGLEFLSETISPAVSFDVHLEPPSVSINKHEGDLLAGIEQEMLLAVSTGSLGIPVDTFVRVKTSKGLQMQVMPKDNPDVKLSESAAENSLSRDFSIPLPVSEPFTNITISLRVLADLSSHKDNSPIHHKVTLTCPWSSSAQSGSTEAVEEEEKIVPLQFLPPFQSSFRLHTAHQRKFLHITICGLSSRAILLRKAKLTIVNEGNSKEFYSYLSLKELNPGSQNLTVLNGTDVSYMWELRFGADQENMKGNHQLYFGGANPPATIHIEFKLEYAGVTNAEDIPNDSLYRAYNCRFEVNDYRTLYEVKSRVEPSKGSEFCRAGGMCHLRLQILRLGPPPPPVPVSSTLQHPSLTSLMYEVLADQTMWAICGRTAGVISLDGEVDKQNVTLDVMPLMGGFLPLPLVRLSKYIPMDSKGPPGREGMSQHPRLEPFSPGQVYNSSKAQQVHVLPSVPPNTSAELPVS